MTIFRSTRSRVLSLRPLRNSRWNSPWLPAMKGLGRPAAALPEEGRLALEERVPIGRPVLRVGGVPIALIVLDELAVDLAVQLPDELWVAVAPLLLGDERRRFPRLGVDGDDLALRAPDAEINPARLVGRDGPGVLVPVLVVDVAVVAELAGLRVEGHETAFRVRGRPDPPLVVLRHAHRHLGRGLLGEGEGALDGVEFREPGIEVRVVFIAARQDRGVGGIAAGRKRHRVFFALPRDDVDEEDGVPAAMVEEPREHDIMPLPVHGGHGAAVVADGRGDAVVAEAVPQVLGGRGGGRRRGQAQGQQGGGQDLQAVFQCHPPRGSLPDL